ncbi:ATP-dependent RNA helicase DbpA [Massilia sp. P8910]|uniref:ATP-dependent RNA helicase DbpA n=1 Tax=Massilia antarctica TaxID=2765360 RepID=UPI0006BB5455|nr:MULTISPECIES: ATP-dependent RNA helicase DbpA [Massilia]MCE3605266.1 ATP-dependent RNA helicase DbpA [Massilia antarctica]MCY0914090.1 ATP-dependent RNA helicase DbpA [Massilia sp. H27-R4]CUI08488.1 ATP-dependent 23S rRNA helicase DbpA [Janthinobacterium sp. CG23_2]CUU32274.1 ATP-dependent 23S rRNA helicase DbpA [Janthinobacterium sp. CG23_2]
MNPNAFATLPLTATFLANLDSLGYREMTDIQTKSLPHVLDGRDLIAQAKTGSGKTAAFGIGILHKLNPAWFAVQGLVLCPTRELADQVANELRRLARGEGNIKVLTLTGGAPMRPQIASLEHGAHIVVGTPGRIRDHLGRGSIDLSKVQTLVLDEADRMTDMGFYDEIAGIVSACPSRRQTLLFSATYPDDIRRATESFLRNPVEVVVEAQHSGDQIEQRFYEVGFDNRDQAVGRLLKHFKPVSALAFCNTKVHCRELADELRAQGFSALALYGELEQRERDEILVLFSNRSCSVLVATDVAARGLDIANLGAVINADVSKDTEVHIHRVGRTGRAGESGLALTLCAPNEKKWVKLIEEYQHAPVSWHPLAELADDGEAAAPAPMVTLVIMGGKKDKLRPGDLLGALTGDAGLTKEQVGKINVFEFMTYVALDRHVAEHAFQRLNAGNKLGRDFGNIKGRSFKMRFIDA